MIYADNAATTRLDDDALNAMLPYLREQYGNASQPYSFSRSAKKALKDARETIASCINANPEQILFTSCGTESDNWVVKGLALSHSTSWRVAVSEIEHHAILNPCKQLEKIGYKINYIPVDKSGLIDRHHFENIKSDFVSVMFANNEIGTIQPIKELSRIAHCNGALFHTDAVQAVGHVQIDVKDLDIDFLSASAHKFNGPKGIGFLYAKDSSLLKAFVCGGSQENGLRAGTENVASIVGMAVALKRNCEEIEANKKHLMMLEDVLFDALKTSEIDFIRNGAKDRIPGNISLSFKNCDGEALLHLLDLKGICVSTGSACDSKNTQVSHVLKAIGLDEDYAQGTIRISLGKKNTIDEVRKIAEVLVKSVGKMNLYDYSGVF